MYNIIDVSDINFLEFVGLYTMTNDFFTVYVIKSSKNNKRYVGFTHKDSLARVTEHNQGCNKWTRNNKPFKLIYQEKYKTKTEAIKREKFLKSGQGRKFLDTIITN